MTKPSEPSLSGTAVLDGRAIYEKTFGASIVESALLTLPAADAEVYAQATPLSWVPTRIVDQVITAVARARNRDPLELSGEMARLSVERTIKTVWRPFLRFTSDDALTTRAPLMYARAFSHGKLAAQPSGPGASQLVVSGWGTMSDLQAGGFAAGVQAVMTVAGRSSVAVSVSREPAGVVFRVTWR